MSQIVRCRHIVAGQVQGVGFRPFVYRLARELGLGGGVRNTPQGVVIEVEGPQAAVAAFGARLPAEIPPLARLTRHEIEALTPTGETAFRIEASAPGAGHDVLISPDVATCPDCLADMADPANRRYRYPFTNCTNCGPRHTITRAIPYDRATTSMACFPLCPACAAEYADPADRRFHAEPVACPVCGPHVWLTDPAGTLLAEHDAAIRALARALAQGTVAAVKGLGGFHLVCDASNDAAVAALRLRKHRPSKALAVMVAGLTDAERLARLDDRARELLSGTVRPIVLVPARKDSGLSPAVAPDTREIGVMLPYTPLHHLILAAFAEALGPGRTAALVMTSGNAGGEPISLGNREALTRLAGIADIFLLHDRDILIRTDDSVVRPLSPDEAPDGGDVPPVMFLRRARGYVPSPVTLPVSGPAVLGLGPMLKATVCLTKGDQAFVSQHIGDLETLETFGFYQETITHMRGVLRVEPQVCVADRHPDYPSTRFALEQHQWPVLRLQHHAAHVYAVLAEHGQTDPALGLALDGTGLGDDGTLWGGEGLLVAPAEGRYERLGHFAPLRLPGGDAAVREPWRIAQACHFALGRRRGETADWPWLAAEGGPAALVETMLEKGFNCPTTTSCGRLFDAVAAVLGLCRRIDYEGQAAILLEQAQDMTETGAYDCPLDASVTPLRLDTLALFDQAATDVRRGERPGRAARRFHLGLLRGLVALAQAMAGHTGLDRVALSGGVLQNRTLAAALPAALRRAGLRPLCHRLLPPHDGCISLGQVFYAATGGG
jgi:hydrogenase maturation protein HypF